jgi:DNA-binding beta-propeller fold protein YncE
MDSQVRRNIRLTRVSWLALVASIALAGCGSTAAQPAPTTVAAVSSPSPAPTVDPTPTPPPLPRIGSIVPEAAIDVDFPTGNLVATDDAIWLFDVDGATRVDPVTNEKQRLELKAADGTLRPSYGGMLAEGSIWVSDFDYDEVRRYDPADGTLMATIHVDAPAGMEFGDGSMWVAGHRDGTVRRIDPATNKEVASIDVGGNGPSGPHELGYFHDRLWVGIPNQREVVAIDPKTNKVDGRIEVESPASPCGGIGEDRGRLIVGSCGDSQSLAVLDIETMASVGSPEFDGYVGAPAHVGDELWMGVNRSTDGDLVTVDPETFKATERYKITGGSPVGRVVAFDSFWLAVEHETERGAWLLRLPLSAFEQ